MQVKDLISNHTFIDFDLIRNNCSQFIGESVGMPIVKNLPETYSDFQKVKVRKRKQSNTFADTFNVAFSDEMMNLRERAVFVNGTVLTENQCDAFYVFPVNGYEYLYSKEVENSKEGYRQVYESIFDTFDDESAKSTFTDLLRFTYVSEDLATGITSGAEIIIYGIPYYYVVRESSVENYDSLLTALI